MFRLGLARLMEGLDSSTIVVRLGQVMAQLINVLSLEVFLCHNLRVLVIYVVLID